MTTRLRRLRSSSAPAELAGTAATPEQQRRRRLDPIMRLHAGRQIDDQQFRAAMEIRAAAELLATSAVSAVDYHRVWAPCAGTYQHPVVAGMSEAVERYRWWIVAVADAGLPISAILDVVRDGLPLRQVETNWRRRNGTLGALVIAALERYVDRANWRGEKAA